MRQKALLILLLLFVSTASADKTVESEPSQSSSDGVPVPAWKQCLNQLCGDDLNKNVRDVMAHAVANAKPLALKYMEIKSAAIAGAQTEMKLQLKKLQQLLQLVRQDTKITDPHVLAFASLLNSFEKMRNVEYKSSLVLDEQKSYDKLLASGASPSEIKATIDLSHKLVKILRSRPMVAVEPLELLKKRYSNKKLQLEIRASIEKIDKAEEKVSKNFGSTRAASFPGLKSWAETKARLLKGPLTELDIEQLSERYNQAALFLDFMNDKPIKNPEAFSIKTMLNAEQLKMAESRVADLEKALGPGASGPLNESVSDIGSTCLGHAVAADLFFPTRAEFEKFKPTEKKWREEYLSQLNGRLSKETFGRLRPKILGLRAVAGRSIENWRESTLRKLAISKTEHEEEMSAIETHEVDRQLTALQSASDMKSQMDDFSVAENVQKICSRAGNFESDEANLVSDIVNIGALSVRNPVGGRGVEFHEYGHHTQDVLNTEGILSDESRKKFEAWEQCLKDAHSGHEKFLSEDFADLVSANFDSRRGGVFCRRISDEDEGIFTIKDPVKDVHSSNLFRLLHFTAIQGKIPEICQSALAAKGESFTLQNCMK